MKGRSSAVRAITELVVIVTGILIALAADAWWQGLTDARLEREYLEAFRQDLQATIRANARAIEGQDSINEATIGLSRRITSSDPLPDTILRIFPTIWLSGESMDTYRDLVASGGTTRISSLRIRRAMSQTLGRVDHNRVNEAWALDLVTSMRSSVWTVPRPVDRERLAELWAVYVDTGSRVLIAKRHLAAAADSALAIVVEELERR